MIKNNNTLPSRIQKASVNMEGFFSLKTSCVLDGNSSRESGGNDGRYQSQLSTSPITGQEGGATGGQRRAEGIPFPLK